MSDSTDVGQFEGLAGLIDNTAYQGFESQPETDVSAGADSAGSDGADEGLSPAVSNTPETPPDESAQEDVTTPPAQDTAGNAQDGQTPVLTAEEAAILQETIRNQQRYIQMHQQQLAVDAERAFQESLKDMTEEEATIAKQNRLIQQLTQERQRDQQVKQAEEAAKQYSAKQTLAVMIASEAGLPTSLSSALMSANSLQEMEQTAAKIAGDLKIGQQVQAPPPPPEPTIDPYAAGGEGGPSNAQPKVEPGSGDLAGLIGQTDYTAVKGW